MAGKQLGRDDERDLFPHALRGTDTVRPRALLTENAHGLLGRTLFDYRPPIAERLQSMGHATQGKAFKARDFGVPQLRPRVAIVALPKESGDRPN